MRTVGDEQQWSEGVLDAAWRASEGTRRWRHRDAGQPGCPAPGPPGAADRRPLEDCVRTGCTDVFHDLAAGVVGRLRASEQRGPGLAWLATVARHELADQERTARVRRGLPARPTRGDGAAAAVEAIIGTLDAPARRREWLLALFRMMRAHACAADRSYPGWPVESWAGQKSVHLGGVTVRPADVAADVRQVLDLATQGAGATWVHRELLLPLMAVRATDVDPDRVLTRTSVEDLAIVALVATSYRNDRAAGRSVQQAWRAAVRPFGTPAGARPPAWAAELLEGWDAC